MLNRFHRILFAAFVLLGAAVTPHSANAQGAQVAPPAAGDPDSCVSAYAGSSYEQIISEAVNYAPAGDLSVMMLGSFFGPSYYDLSYSSSGGNAPAAPDFTELLKKGQSTGDATPEPDSEDSLGVMFSGIFGLLSLIMNAACIALVGWLILVVLITGSLNSAHEGIVLGQQYSTLWVPIRSVIALGGLMPLFGGYSLAQQLLMVAGRIAIGFANIAFQGGLAFTVAGGGAIVEPPLQSTHQLVASLVQSEMCAAFAEDSGYSVDRNISSAPDPVNLEAKFWQKESLIGPKKLVYRAAYDVSGGVEHGEAACGRFELLVPSLHGENIKPQQEAKIRQVTGDYWAAINSARVAAAPIAKALAMGQPVDANAWATIENNLQNRKRTLLNELRIAAITGNDGENRALVCSAINEMRDIGWSMLGAVYWTVANTTAEQNRNVVSFLGSTTHVPPTTSRAATDIEPPVQSAPFRRTSVIVDYASAITRYGETYAKVSEIRAVQRQNDWATPSDEMLLGVSMGADGQIDSGKAGTWLSGLPYLRDLSDKVVAGITEEGDFVSNLAGVGHYIVSAGAAITGLAVGAKAMEQASDVNPYAWLGKQVLGLNPWTSVPTTIARTIAGMAVYIITMVGLPLLLMGFYLAFYLPSVPIIYWFGSLTSWLIANITAVLSAPIWMASHVVPAGNGFSSDQARNGYMTLLSIFLRPLLMVIGFFAGIACLQIMGIAVSIIFPIAFRDIMMDSMYGIFSFFATMALFIAILVSIFNRVMSLAFEIADDILEYYGGGRRQLGDQQTAQNASSMFLAATINRPESLASTMATAGRNQQRATGRGPDNPGGGGDKDKVKAAT